MKKWGFLLLFLLCLGFADFASINKVLFFQDEVVIQKYDQSHKDNKRTSENLQKKDISKEQIYQGNLLLINSKYPVRKRV